MSILSEKKPIEHWLNTPLGYYVGLPLYGNKISLSQFKNMALAKYELGNIADDIREDLGNEVADSISSINLIKDDFGTLYIGIVSRDGEYSIGEVI